MPYTESKYKKIMFITLYSIVLHYRIVKSFHFLYTVFQYPKEPCRFEPYVFVKYTMVLYYTVYPYGSLHTKPVPFRIFFERALFYVWTYYVRTLRFKYREYFILQIELSHLHVHPLLFHTNIYLKWFLRSLSSDYARIVNQNWRANTVCITFDVP